MELGKDPVVDVRMAFMELVPELRAACDPKQDAMLLTSLDQVLSNSRVRSGSEIEIFQASAAATSALSPHSRVSRTAFILSTRSNTLVTGHGHLLLFVALDGMLDSGSVNNGNLNVSVLHDNDNIKSTTPVRRLRRRRRRIRRLIVICMRSDHAG